MDNNRCSDARNRNENENEKQCFSKTQYKVKGINLLVFISILPELAD